MEEILKDAIYQHQSGNLEGALELYRSILIDYGEHAHVFYLMGVASHGLGKYENAVDAFEVALRLDPTHAPTACGMGNSLSKLNYLEDACKAYRLALEIRPFYTEATTHLLQLLVDKAQFLIDSGDCVSAQVAVDEAYQLNESNVSVLHLCGSLAFKKGELDQAETFFRRVLDKTPEDATVHFNLGRIFFEQKKFAWALGAFKSSLERDSTCANTLLLAGKSAVHQGLFGQALDYLEKYKQIGITPLDRNFNYYYGETLRNQDKPREAIVHLQKFIVENPRHVEAYVSLGNALRKQKKYEASANSFQKALEIDADHFDALFCASLTYREYKEKDKNENMNRALEYATKALTMTPENAGCLFNISNVYMDFGLPSDSAVHYAKALEYDRENASSESSFCFNSNYIDTLSREELFKQHVTWGEKYIERHRAERLVHKNSAEPHRRIRLGFISPDLCIHPVGYFFKPVFMCLDKNEFETFLYYNNFDDKPIDTFSHDFKERADHWYEIQKKERKELAEFIHSHEIDILIDLAGHSCGHKLLAMAYKPAPIQMTWLGYPNTTGSSAIDYRIVDGITDPVEHQAISAEKLLQLPCGFNCYNMPYKFPEMAAEIPVVKNGYITFGSFNNTCKHTPTILQLWGRIVHSIPNARLVFKDKFLALQKTRNYILENVCSAGLEPSRVQFLDFSASNYEHIEQYTQIDIALDPHPYNGTTTTCEALLMGVPILTRLGDRHASRVTASVLSRIGLDDWVARDEEHLVELAHEKAANIQALRELHPTLRQRMLESTVCDAPRFTQQFEASLREVWRKWCEVVEK